MTKSLRLAVAELSDIGRKREGNQDNVTHVIPPEEDVLAEKGALFVICDGMGGHASGEIASGLGIRSIRDGYYGARGEDIVSALARAVEQANAAIYNHAREHAESAGMGTTCVIVVISNGRAYTVNIGDSRAYVVRQHTMRQITRDHSWVAEQQRIGLLTPEQARQHAHRNVITRSLGTQPSVTADLFVEPLYDGDLLLLCSDGLHGYVEESAIRDVMVHLESPESGVHHLIDMANANGGPDNITAVIVHLLQVPQAMGEVTLPAALVAVGQAAVDEVATQPLPMAALQAPSNVAVATAPASAPVASLAQGATAASSHGSAPGEQPTKRSRRPLVAIVLIAVLLLAAVGAGGWYVSFGRGLTSQAADNQTQNDLARAQQIVRQAPTDPPTQALVALATARALVLADVNNTSVAAHYRELAATLLTSEIEPAVRAAVQRYNAVALVTPITPQAIQVSCQPPGASSRVPLDQVTALAAVTWSPPSASAAANDQVLYALRGGHIFELLVPQSSAPATCALVSLPASIVNVIAIAGDGAVLYVLAEQNNNAYTVYTLTPQSAAANGSPVLKLDSLITPPAGPFTPALLVADGNNVSIGYSGGSGAGIWLYSGTAPTAPTTSVVLPMPAVSLTAANSTVYILLNDGELGQIGPDHQYVPLPVSVLNPVQPADPNAYAISAPVPTPQPTEGAPVSAAPAAPATSSTATRTTPAATSAAGAVATATAAAHLTPTATSVANATTTVFGGGGALATAPGFPTHLLVGDSTNGRVVWFNASASGPGLAPAAQFAYTPAAGASQVAAISRSGSVTIYIWNSAGLSTFVAPTNVPGQ